MPVKPMLLGISGFKESGKNTAAEFIAERCAEKKKFRTRSQGLADDLKISAAKALGFEANDDAGLIDAMNQMKVCGSVVSTIEHGEHDIQEAVINGREFLQKYGTEAHREVFGDDFWIDNLLPFDEAELERKWGEWDTEPTGLFLVPDLMQVTDVRFPNEARRVHELNGFVLEIQKPGTGGDDSHASEKPLPRESVDHIIVNDGTLLEFEKKMQIFTDQVVIPAIRAGLWG